MKTIHCNHGSPEASREASKTRSDASEGPAEKPTPDCVAQSQKYQNFYTCPAPQPQVLREPTTLLRSPPRTFRSHRSLPARLHSPKARQRSVDSRSMRRRSESCDHGQLQWRGRLINPRLGTYMLVLYVGPYRTLTTIHNDVLPTSTIIALRGLYQYGFAHLEAHSVESFELYRVWLYTGKLCTRIPNEEEEVGAEDAVWVDCEWGRMANAYFLAVDLRDEKFGNAIVDAMIEKVDGSEYYPTSLAADLYASTPQGDGMSRLIVDFHVWKEELVLQAMCRLS